MYRQWNRGITKGNIWIMSLPQIKSQLKSDHKKISIMCCWFVFSYKYGFFFLLGKSHLK